MIKRIAKIFIIFIIILLLYLFIPRKSNKLIFFPSKNSNSFKEYLINQDIPINSFDIVILKFFNVQKGWIRSDEYINKIDLIKLATAKKNEKKRYMVMYSGDRVEHFLKQISKQANLNYKLLLKIFKQKNLFDEASILAKRYKTPYRVNESSIVAYFLANSIENFKNLAKRYNLDINSKEFKNKLIVASIIQKETQNYKEMPLIASVIYNRLKKGLKLQMDATLNYGKNSHKIITPKIIREDNSKFNTYKFKDLPPKPLCSVSITALKAALNPAKSDYLYFVKSKNRHIFTKKYSKHKIEVSKYKHNLELKRLIKKEFRRVSKIEFKPTIFKIYLN